jgi:hypothetical protein
MTTPLPFWNQSEISLGEICADIPPRTIMKPSRTLTFSSDSHYPCGKWKGGIRKGVSASLSG